VCKVGGVVLCWDNVAYHAGRMASMGGGRSILEGCSGIAKPGEVMAISLSSFFFVMITPRWWASSGHQGRESRPFSTSSLAGTCPSKSKGKF